MSDVTYEFETRRERLETYEWDNVWWEHPGETDVPRVLYIGDSISMGTRRLATVAAENKIYFDGFASSKAVDNPYFAESVRLFAKQQGERAAIFFNNGLHGWHLEDEGTYKQAYESILNFLQAEFKGTPIVLLLSTHVADEARDARVQARNRAVEDLAKKYGLRVLDLYMLTQSHADLLSTDGVHFTQDGYHLIADALVKCARELI